MITTEHKVGRMNLKLVEYKDLTEFAKLRKSQQYHIKQNDPRWAGGTAEDLYRGCERGDMNFASRAEKYVSKFANSAIEDYEMTLEWNEQNGELDYEAAMAGEELYMYGPTIEKTDRAAVNLYIDQWASCTIKPAVMMRRGVAVLALVQALGIYRPVNAYIATGTGYMPTKMNLVQVVRVPTNPMDLARAAWMLAAPMFFRQGQLPMVNAHAESSRSCGVPPLKDTRWQTENMGKWLAEREGVHDCIHLPLMMDSGIWTSDEATLEWVKDNMKRMLPDL